MHNTGELGLYSLANSCIMSAACRRWSTNSDAADIRPLTRECTSKFICRMQYIYASSSIPFQYTQLYTDTTVEHVYALPVLCGVVFRIYMYVNSTTRQPHAHLSARLIVISRGITWSYKLLSFLLKYYKNEFVAFDANCKVKLNDNVKH